jgi:uncharacterized repeat protein (TIGR01451 family)
VRAASAHQDQLAIYAARRSSDSALTLMIINKTGTALTSTVTISNFVPALTAQVYRYSASALQAIVPQPGQAVSATGFTAAFPANSITLVVVPLALQISKTAWPTQNLHYGDTVTYTLTLADEGRSAQMPDSLPAGLSYVPGSLNPAPPVTAYDGVNRISWQGIAPTGGLTITFQAQVTGGLAGSPAPAILNTVTLTDTVTGRAVQATALVNSFKLFLPLVQR